MKNCNKMTTENNDERQPFYEMVCVSKQDTGLPCDLWLDSLGKERIGEIPLPHVSVSVGEKSIFVYLPEAAAANPTTVKIVGKYINAYARVLLAHYDRQITDKQALTLLSRIEEADSKLVNRTLKKAGAIEG